MRFRLAIFVFLQFVLQIDGSNILAIFPICAASHFNLGYPLVKELADRGHKVTMINCFPERTQSNVRDVSVAKAATILQGLGDVLVDFGQMSYWGQLNFLAEFGKINTKYILEIEAVQELLNSDEKYDVIILENFANDAMAIFKHKFNCPLIIFAPGPTTMFNNHLLGNPAPPAFVPNLLGAYNSEMSFWERLQNTYKYILGELFVHFKHLPQQNELLKTIIPDAPDLDQLVYNVSLMLLTSHISLNDPVPLLPNIKDVGGIHVLPTKPLPKDLQEFLDNATDGAILFSMGSNLQSSKFDEGKRKAILNVFSKMKQKVIWKFETDLPDKPDNVMIMKWLPQQDIMAHPNTIAFISHGGLLGTIEAVYFGVPILGLPVYWDQAKNIEEAGRKGFATKVDFHNLNEETFGTALNELVNNPKYLKIVKERSKIMHDQPVTQKEEAVFWVEYVIRHKGAYHLQSVAVKLKWYQRYLVDIVVFLSVVFVLFLLIPRMIFRALFGKKHSGEKLKKN